MPDSKRGLKFLAETILGETRQSYEDVVEKNMCFSQIKIEDALKYAASDADNTLQLYKHFQVQRSIIKLQKCSMRLNIH